MPRVDKVYVTVLFRKAHEAERPTFLKKRATPRQGTATHSRNASAASLRSARRSLVPSPKFAFELGIRTTFRSLSSKGFILRYIVSMHSRQRSNPSIRS